VEQKESSNETAAIIDAAPSKDSLETEKEECVVLTAFVIKKHLTEIYQRLNQLEAKIENHIAAENQKADAIDRTKLSVQEFRKFLDLLSETLIEALPNAAPAADGSTPETPLKNESIQGETAIRQNMEPEQTQRNETKTASLQPTHQRNFLLKTNGEIFYVGNGVTIVVGDAEIPRNTEVDESLVIKGSLKIGEACKFLKDVKALQNIEIGRNSTVEGNLMSGGKITMGPNCQVKGTIQGEIQEGANDKLSVDNSGS
jgi:UDP-3-O-[3-hydroxymyristoyl] glucosamine N-acyltransferase